MDTWNRQYGSANFKWRQLWKGGILKLWGLKVHVLINETELSWGRVGVQENKFIHSLYIVSSIATMVPAGMFEVRVKKGIEAVNVAYENHRCLQKLDVNWGDRN